MIKKFEIVVGPLYTPKRIDSYLAQVFDGEFSRNEIKNSIDQSLIFLNGKEAKPRTLVSQNDVIKGEISSDKKTSLVPEKIQIDVLYEDESLLVINKKEGMVVHPGAGNKTGTLVQALLGRQTPLSNLSGEFRPGIVHRIDKDTSGLLLVAKTNFAHRALQEQFASRSVSKTYMALVKGRIEFEEGRLQKSIGRDPKIREKMAVSIDTKAKEALTFYRVEKRFKAATLLKIKILTGRTHQIRVHLADLGNPVIGDVLYGDKDSTDRLALHASSIEFSHPKSGKIMSFESPLPATFEEVIKKYEAR